MKHVLDDHEPVIGRAGLFSLGLIALFASAILYNAFIAQSAPHPAPMASGWVVENSGEAVQLRARDVALKSDNESHSEGRGRVMMEIPAPRQQEAATGRPDNRSLIHSIQTELAAFGLYEDAIDGLAGPRTRDAIHVYQRSMGLQATGEATEDLLDHIRFNRHIREAARYTGSTGDGGAGAQEHRVRRVQKGLAELGYAPGPVDGIVGDQTREAIRAFQTDRGLRATGQIDEVLINELSKVSGITSLGGLQNDR